MNTRKEKLVTSLNVAIRALETGTVCYNWTEQDSCNCGVVAQAILGVTATTLNCRIKAEGLFNHDNFTSNKRKQGWEGGPTWQNAVKTWCPITNAPLKNIFIELEQAGLGKEDICHLEYMDNQAILKRAGLSELRNAKPNLIKKIHKFIANSAIGKLFKMEQQHKFYANQDNLIKYLKGWVSILSEEQPETSDFKDCDVNNLNERLLCAVAEEDYTTAATIRDTINTRI